MSKPVYLVIGGKGGVGKSAVASALMHHQEVTTGEVPALIEGDKSIPDVGWAYSDEEGVLYAECNLIKAQGWIELLKVIEGNPNKAFVINMPPRSEDAVWEFGEALKASLSNLKKELIAVWILSANRICIDLLQEFMTRMAGTRVIAVRNLMFGPVESFETYNNSGLKLLVEETGATIDFPVLGGRVANQLANRHWPIARGVEQLSIGSRAELQRWQRAVKVSFDPVFTPKQM
jgi:hypothetical protein